MLQDRIFSSVEFLRLLQITRGTLDNRTAKGEIAYAFGCPINAHVNGFLPVDALAVLMTSWLSHQFGRLDMKVAARVVREHSPAWLKLVQTAEDDPLLYEELPPAPEQLWLMVGIDDGEERMKLAAGLQAEARHGIPTDEMLDRVKHYTELARHVTSEIGRPKVTTGKLYHCITELGSGYPFFGAISIHQLLHQLRANARAAGITPPMRLTVSASDPNHAKWHEEIAAYQKLAHRRFEAKTKAKSAKARVPA